jgi:hypothetical protein
VRVRTKKETSRHFQGLERLMALAHLSTFLTVMYKVSFLTALLKYKCTLIVSFEEP